MTRRTTLQLASAWSARRTSSSTSSSGLWQQWMESASVPGVAVLEVQAGKPPRIDCAGVCHAGSSATEAQKVNDNTQFAAASLSKQLTAYAFLQLIAQGKVGLDQPLGEIVAMPGQPKAGLATPRWLLSHSTGWPNWRFETTQLLELGSSPGKTFRYSGEGYVYLQRAIEKLTGQPFARYMREAVLAPLGMTHSSFVFTPGPNQAAPHNRQGQPFPPQTEQRARREELLARWKLTAEEMRIEDLERLCQEEKSPPLPNWFPINAAASLRTTPADYARFLTHILAAKSWSGPESTIVEAAGGRLGWGLGWGRETREGKTYYWQWGDNGGYKNFVWVDGAASKAWAIFTNGDKGRAVYERILRSRTGLDPAAFLWM